MANAGGSGRIPAGIALHIDDEAVRGAARRGRADIWRLPAGGLRHGQPAAVAGATCHRQHLTLGVRRGAGRVRRGSSSPSTTTARRPPGRSSSGGVEFIYETTPYPSELQVSGVGTVQDLDVTLHGFTSTYPEDARAPPRRPDGRPGDVDVGRRRRAEDPRPHRADLRRRGGQRRYPSSNDRRADSGTLPDRRTSTTVTAQTPIRPGARTRPAPPASPSSTARTPTAPGGCSPSTRRRRRDELRGRLDPGHRLGRLGGADRVGVRGRRRRGHEVRRGHPEPRRDRPGAGHRRDADAVQQRRPDMVRRSSRTPPPRRGPSAAATGPRPSTRSSATGSATSRRAVSDTVVLDTTVPAPRRSGPAQRPGRPAEGQGAGGGHRGPGLRPP